MSTSPPESTPARPPQVTLFGWMVIASAVVVVLSAWETVASARSLDTTETLQSLIEEPPFRGLALEQVRQVHRIAAIVAAGAAGGAAVFAVHVLRRDRTARIVVSVLAVPVLLAGFVMGGLSTTLLAVAAMMLWLQPSRDWFDGKDYVAPEPREADPPPAEPRPGPWAPPSETDRRADVSAAAVSLALAPAPPRPPALARAAFLAAVSSVTMFLLATVGLLALVSNPDGVLTGVRQQDPTIFERGVGEGQMLTLVGVVLGMMALWSVVAVVLSLMVFRGAEWARVTLVVSSIAAGALALAASLINPVMLVLAGAGGLTVALLVRSDVVGWCRRRRTGEIPRRDEMVR